MFTLHGLQARKRQGFRSVVQINQDAARQSARAAVMAVQAGSGPLELGTQDDIDVAFCEDAPFGADTGQPAFLRWGMWAFGQL